MIVQNEKIGLKSARKNIMKLKKIFFVKPTIVRMRVHVMVMLLHRMINFISATDITLLTKVASSLVSPMPPMPRPPLRATSRYSVANFVRRLGTSQNGSENATDSKKNTHKAALLSPISVNSIGSGLTTKIQPEVKKTVFRALAVR